MNKWQLREGELHRAHLPVFQQALSVRLPLGRLDEAGSDCLELGLLLLACAAESGRGASLVDPFPEHLFPRDAVTRDCDWAALRRCLQSCPAIGQGSLGGELTETQSRLLDWQQDKLRLRRAAVDAVLCQPPVRPADRASWWASGPTHQFWVKRLPPPSTMPPTNIRLRHRRAPARPPLNSSCIRLPALTCPRRLAGGADSSRGPGMAAVGAGARSCPTVPRVRASELSFDFAQRPEKSLWLPAGPSALVSLCSSGRHLLPI